MLTYYLVVVNERNTSSRLLPSVCKETILRLCCKDNSSSCLRSSSGFDVATCQVYGSILLTVLEAGKRCSHSASSASLKETRTELVAEALLLRRLLSVSSATSSPLLMMITLSQIASTS